MQIRLFHQFIAVVTVSLLIFCGKSGQEQPQNKSTKTSQTQNVDELKFHHYYAGLIGGAHSFKMELSKTDSIITGSYAYDKHKSAIYIFGKYLSHGSFKIREFNDPSFASDTMSSTGIFEGTTNGDSIFGIWFNKDHSKSFPFSAKRFAPDKKTVLNDAI